MPANVVLIATGASATFGSGPIGAAPAPGPSITLSGPTTATAGSAATYTVTAANLTGPLVVTPVNVTGTAVFSPSTVNPAPGELSKLFSATWAAAGSYSIKATAPGVADSNTLAVSVSGVPTPPPPPPAPAPSGTVATLAVRSTGSTGTYPYSATVMPLRGQVPSGNVLVSSGDASLRSAVLATHDDGSAALMVVSGSVTVTGGGTVTVSLQNGTASGTNLTAAAIAAQVTSVSVAFGGTYGTASLSSFGSPERIWWQTPGTICARYRVAAPTPGSTALEAVIDIQAWADRALVEVVVENGAMNSTTPTAPADALYTGAVVSINGSTVATVNGNGAPEGAHAKFRAWYVSGWVGAGNPGLVVTQPHTELQNHPLLPRLDQANTADLSIYASDAYTPWATGRHRATGMGGGGDHPSIGPLPQWEMRALQTGDVRAWNAVEVSALAVLGYNINNRDTLTGRVTTYTAVGNRAMTGGVGGAWPSTWTITDMGWVQSHHPAAGLMAFIKRPSPVFIEIAQKIALWCGIWSGSNNGTFAGTPGLFGYFYQVRGRAWGMRSLTHATFLTPDGDAWKTAAKTALYQNVLYLDQWRTDSKFALGIFCDNGPSAPEDAESGTAGFQWKGWQHHYLATELGKAAQARMLSGTQLSALETIADWALSQPVRWVNEQAGGGWRYISYHTTVGNNATTIGSAADWGAQMASAITGSPSGASGPIYDYLATPAAYSDFTTQAVGGALYASYWWAALVMAVERGVPGADDAWRTVNVNATNLSTFRAGFATDPRWGSAPRGFAAGAEAGTLVANVWTPGRNAQGLVTKASVDTLPANTWVQVAGTSLQSLKTLVEAGGFSFTTDDWSVSKAISATLYAWVGGATDGRRMLFERGGGHFDSSVNGSWAFDLGRMSWGVERQPSIPSATGAVWDPGYDAPTATNNIGFTNYFTASPGVAGLDADGLYRDRLPDNTPTSAHTYGGVYYDRKRKQVTTSRISKWTRSLETNTWARQRWTVSGTPSVFSIGQQLHYHEGRDATYGYFSLNDYDYYSFGKVVEPGAAYTALTACPNWKVVNGFSSVRLDNDRILFCWCDDGPGPERWGIFNMATETWEAGSGNTIANPKAYDYSHEMMPMIFVPQWGAAGQVIRRGTYGALLNQWWVFDVATKTNQTYTPAGNPPPAFIYPDQSWPGSKWRYLPQLGLVFALFDVGSISNDSVYVMRTA